MKRNELTVGMRVEIQNGRDYPTFNDAIVLATEPWVHTGSSWYRSEPPRPALPRENQQGVAVALRDLHSDAWRAGVVQLRTIVPVGTAAAHQEAEQQRRAQAARRDRRRRNRARRLADQLGVEPYEVTIGRWGVNVTVPIDALETALARLPKE